jgi:hypothetical protein
MTPIEFKELWLPDTHSKWIEFDILEIEKAPINDLTKSFLKIGFPEGPAPYLDFGWLSQNNKFYSIYDYYSKFKLTNLAQNYWMFGSDGNGNPICFDVSANDRIVLLDHEQNFEIIDKMNANIAELAAYLLLYKDFVTSIRNKNKGGSFTDSDISEAQLLNLKEGFKLINNNIFKESGFWRSEINSLRRK